MNESPLRTDEQICSPGSEPALKTLSCIEHVLHMYWCPERFGAHPAALEWLLDNGLIAPTEGGWWFVTDRGKAYCEGIRDVPLPVQFTEWRIP